MTRNFLPSLSLFCYELLYALRPFGFSDVRVQDSRGNWQKAHDERAPADRLKRVWFADLS